MKPTYYLAFALLLLVLSCSNTHDLEVPFTTVSGIFDEDAPENTHLVRNVLSIGQYHYAIDLDRVHIHKINNLNEIVTSAGGKGFGPAEFQKIVTFQTDGNYLFAFDNVAKKVVVLDWELKLVNEFSLRESVVDINFTIPGVAYGTHLTMDGWSLIRYDKSTFDLPDYLYIENTRRPEFGASMLNVYENEILIHHIFTNRSTLFNKESQSTSRIVFEHLDSRPPLRRVGGYEVPEAPVWMGGERIDDWLIQLAKLDERYTVLLTELSGVPLKRFEIEEDLDTARITPNGVYGTLGDKTYHYPLELFTGTTGI